MLHGSIIKVCLCFNCCTSKLACTIADEGTDAAKDHLGLGK